MQHLRKQMENSANIYFQVWLFVRAFAEKTGLYQSSKIYDKHLALKVHNNKPTICKLHTANVKLWRSFIVDTHSVLEFGFLRRVDMSSVANI
jgi:hypothetical protein